MPGIVDMMASATQAAITYAKTGTTTPEIRESRLGICRGCEHFIPGTSRCDICKCFMKVKTWIAGVSCPDDPPRWGPAGDTAAAAGESPTNLPQASQGCGCGKEQS